MLDTTTPHPQPSHHAAVSDVLGVDVRALDDRSVLTFVVAQRRNADQAEADLLAGVVHWADLHPVTEHLVAGRFVGDAGAGAASWPLDRPLGGILPPDPDDQGCRLAGIGAPEVTETAVVDLAAALGVSYRAGLQLVADTLELHYRLPRLWALVQAGTLAAWKARHVAAQTTHLSQAAALFVDRHLSVLARRGDLPPSRVRPLIHEALLHHDPEVAAGVEEAALGKRGVWFDHRQSTATTTLTGILDTLDAIDLDHTLSDIAAQLKNLGDTDHLDTRRAHALGLLADPQRALDLFTHPTSQHPDQQDTAETSARADSTNNTANTTNAAGTGNEGDEHAGGPFRRTSATVYLHLTLADLATSNPDNSTPTGPFCGSCHCYGGGTATGHNADARGLTSAGGGWVEKLGPASLQLLQDWLTRIGLHGPGVTIRPVLDMNRTDNRTDAVDRHDPPEWMRELVILRDKHCVFPGCGIDARSCDLDHIKPYVPLDARWTARPNPRCNLAALCRRHHRAKTHRAWSYRRRPPDEPDGRADARDTIDGPCGYSERNLSPGYTWTSPLGWTLTTHPL